jgi:hypothetical protein
MNTVSHKKITAEHINHIAEIIQRLEHIPCFIDAKTIKANGYVDLTERQVASTFTTRLAELSAAVGYTLKAEGCANIASGRGRLKGGERSRYDRAYVKRA